MNKEQWDIIVTGVLDFNRLITTPEERKTEGYLLKCFDLQEEEYDKEFLVHYEKWKSANLGSLRSMQLETLLVDDICDSIVTTVQLADSTTPSSLEWEYIDLLLQSEVWVKRRDILIKPMLHVLQVSEGMGFDIFGAMCEVNRSNNTKIPTVDLLMQYYGDDKEIYELPVDVAANYAAADIAADLDYEFEITPRIFIDQYGVDRVAFYDCRGKLRKPWCYEEPLLGGYL